MPKDIQATKAKENPNEVSKIDKGQLAISNEPFEG